MLVRWGGDHTTSGMAFLLDSVEAERGREVTLLLRRRLENRERRKTEVIIFGRRDHVDVVVEGNHMLETGRD